MGGLPGPLCLGGGQPGHHVREPDRLAQPGARRRLCRRNRCPVPGADSAAGWHRHGGASQPVAAGCHGPAAPVSAAAAALQGPEKGMDKRVFRALANAWPGFASALVSQGACQYSPSC
eukprot:gene34236-56973_t